MSSKPKKSVISRTFSGIKRFFSGRNDSNVDSSASRWKRRGRPDRTGGSVPSKQVTVPKTSGSKLPGTPSVDAKEDKAKAEKAKAEKAKKDKHSSPGKR